MALSKPADMRVTLPVGSRSIILANLTGKVTLISAGFDKAIKLWEIESNQYKLINTLKHLKKIDFGFWDPIKKRLVFSDKTGEIHETYLVENALTKPVLIQANMATLFSLETSTLDHSTAQLKDVDAAQCLILTDEYNRIKVFKYPEVQHLLAFFSPYDHPFKQVLNMSPNCLVGLTTEGIIDLISLSCIKPSIYSAKQLPIKEKFKDKKPFRLCALDSSTLLVLDEYFTQIYICVLKEDTIIQDKVIDISKLNLIDNSKKYHANRGVEVAENQGQKYIVLIYENEIVEHTHNDNKVTKNDAEHKYRLSDKVELTFIKISTVDQNI